MRVSSLARLAPGNPMRTPLAATLISEVVVFGLAIPGMILVSAVPAGTAALLGGLCALLALVAAASLRRGWGYPVAWLTQVAGIALGLATPMMYLVGVIFAVIWVASFVMGRRLEKRSPDTH